MLAAHPRQHAGLLRGRAARACPGRSRLHVACAVKERAGKQVCCSKTMVAKKGSEAAVSKMLEQLLQYSEAQMKDRSSGIVLFQVANDRYQEATFHTWERYESTAAFSRHTTSPDVMRFLEGVQQHLEGPVGVALYEWNNGQLGPVGLNEGPKGEGGLDDATGASGAAGGASMKQTSASFDLTAGEETIEEVENKLFGGLDAAKKQVEDLVGNLFGKKDKKTEGSDKGAGGFLGKMFGKKK